MKKMVIGSLYALVMIGLGFVFAVELPDALDKWQECQCLKLQKQAQERKGGNFFYLTQMEKETCDEIGVVIDAPVRVVKK